MAHKGKFVPRNKQKYRGSTDNITYRSGWELHVMSWLDRNDNVEWWNSEGTIVPYYSPMDQRNRRYFIDFTVKFAGDDRIHWFEVKPHNQTQAPVAPRRFTVKSRESYEKQATAWILNTAKWKAAVEASKKNNCSFRILTEVSLKKYFGMRG